MRDYTHLYSFVYSLLRKSSFHKFKHYLGFPKIFNASTRTMPSVFCFPPNYGNSHIINSLLPLGSAFKSIWGSENLTSSLLQHTSSQRFVIYLKSFHTRAYSYPKTFRGILIYLNVFYKKGWMPHPPSRRVYEVQHSCLSCFAIFTFKRVHRRISTEAKGAATSSYIFRIKYEGNVRKSRNTTIPHRIHTHMPPFFHSINLN